MNDYYAANWHAVRGIEGASQRVQEGPIIDGNGFHLLRMIGDLYVGTAKTAPFVAKTTVTINIPLNR